MICHDGVVALYSFFVPAAIFVLLFLWSFTFNLIFSGLGYAILAVSAIYFIVISLVTSLFYKGHDYQIALRATFLGCVFATGLYVNSFASEPVQIFGVYMCIMAFFHYSEYVAIAIIHPTQVSTDSFVINHSPQYITAAVSSWLEFGLESYFFPGMKTVRWLSNIGLCICVIGEIIRKVAMLTAKSNFNHLVQCEKSDDHILVTHGIYGWSRHPSYVGWFYWSIGTQIVLLNPFCVIAYTLASWFFFNERIAIEEITLLNFFGQQYCDYQKRVGTGLPFIKGYRIKP